TRHRRGAPDRHRHVSLVPHGDRADPRLGHARDRSPVLAGADSQSRRARRDPDRGWPLPGRHAGGRGDHGCRLPVARAPRPRSPAGATAMTAQAAWYGWHGLNVQLFGLVNGWHRPWIDAAMIAATALGHPSLYPL